MELSKETNQYNEPRCTSHICGICDKFSVLMGDGEPYQYTCGLCNKTIPAIGAVRDIRPKDFKEEKQNEQN